MTAINVEEIRSIKERLKQINDMDLKDIQFFENQEPVQIDPKVLKDFKFSGLNNCDFITTDFYKTGFKTEVFHTTPNQKMS